jgi:hypothetical protein
MKSEKTVKRMSLSENENEHFFFEGYLGKLKDVSMIEDMMLQIDGVNGTLRMDITKQELQKILHLKRKKQGSGQQ